MHIFMVRTEGPDGKLRDFAVKPLQQYLIEFPGGRLQAVSPGCYSVVLH